MRINLLNKIKYPVMTLFTTCSLGFAKSAKAQQVKIVMKPDTFEMIKVSANPVDKYTQEDLPAVFREKINPSGWTNDAKILKNAPSPKFKLMGKETLATVVVDVKNCLLFRYDKKGKPIEAFKAAVGAPSSPTPEGVAKVISKLTYPYSTSPRTTKRRRRPRNFGPKILYIRKVDTKTGKLHDDGRYLHGTRYESAIEKGHITLGCIRVHNRDILYLSDVLDKSIYILFKK